MVKTRYELWEVKCENCEYIKQIPVFMPIANITFRTEYIVKIISEYHWEYRWDKTFEVYKAWCPTCTRGGRTPEEYKEFEAQLKQAVKEIMSWPKWKQKAIAESVQIPQQPEYY